MIVSQDISLGLQKEGIDYEGLLSFAKRYNNSLVFFISLCPILAGNKNVFIVAPISKEDIMILLDVLEIHGVTVHLRRWNMNLKVLEEEGPFHVRFYGKNI